MSASNLIYLAYATADEGQAQNLAEALEERGSRVFLRAWDIVPGQVRIHRMDDAIQDCTAAVLLLSEASRKIEEYPALTHRADRGGLSLVPVLLAGGVIPPALSGRAYVDFAGIHDEQDFARRVAALTDALNGTPVPRRSRAGLNFGLVREEPLVARLRITATATILTRPGGGEVTAPHDGLGPGLRQLLWTTGRARHLPDRRADIAIARLGGDLGRRFLGGDVGSGITGLLATADRRNQSLRLGIEIDPDAPDLADLPWEHLIAPGAPTPLALHPRVRLHRVADLAETVQIDVPGPLRILAVVASPDHGDLELLDYEHELGEILDRVEEARRDSAHVRILNWGSIAAIREALTRERFHVLHLSCHAEPGVLLLETADGRPDPVDAPHFAAELVVADRGVPLVVLAGCDTARGGETPDQLPGFAQTLLAYGVPAVLAMTERVTDAYATALMSRMYGRLARATGPADPLTALSDVRREIEASRPGQPATDPVSRLPEWPMAALFTRVDDVVLYDARAPAEPLAGVAPDWDLADGIIGADRGEFVGRRADLRRLLRTMRGPERGVLIFGMGGVGKSSLAVQLVRMAAGERTVVASLHGRCGPDEILEEVAGQIHLEADDARLRRRLTDRQDSWDWRLRLLRRWLGESGREVLVLLDDPLGDPIRAGDGDTWREQELDDETRRFLVAWLRLGRSAALVVTAREAGAFGRAGPPLLRHHLGPLSQAETYKLFWRLPALAALAKEEQQRAYRDLGGHPRALEYLDALLRAGHDTDTGAPVHRRRFVEIADRMESTLRGTGIADPTGWMRTAGHDVDTAIAEVVAQSSADVLLDRILQRLDPHARDLLVAASVYRLPVDTRGLSWVVTTGPVLEPEQRERLRRAYGSLLRMQRRGLAPILDDLPVTAEVRAELDRDLLTGTLPPDVPWLAEARDTLVDLGLLTPAGDDHYLVHRWTGAALAAAMPDAVRPAHLRAAAYRRWWAGLRADDPEYDHTDLEEARHHYAAAGDVRQMTGVAAALCIALHARSALRAEVLVCTETLAAIGDVPDARLFRHQLGVIARGHGDYRTAQAHLRWCLTVAEEHRDLVAQAGTLTELGAVAQLSGNVSIARDHYKQAIGRCSDPSVRESPPARTVLASCYQQLGALELAQEDDEAWRWSAGALDIAEELEEDAGPAGTERDLARLARALGQTDRADQHEIRAGEHAAIHRDAARLIAASALQTGAVRLLSGSVVLATEPLVHALEVAGRLRDLPLYAQCLQLSGDVLFEAGKLDEATVTYRRFAEAAADLGDPVRQAVAEQQLGRVLAEQDPADAAGVAAEHFAEATAIAERLGDRVLISSSHLFRGAAAEQAGRAGEAREQLRLAQRDAESETDAVWIAAAMQLGSLDARDGQPDRAAAWFRLACEAADRAGNQGAAISSLTALALLDREQQRDDHAVIKLREAERRARAAGNDRAAAGALLHLGRIASDGLDREAAEAAYGSVVALLDANIFPDFLAEAYRHRGRVRAMHDDHDGALADLDHALGFYRRYEIGAAVALCQLYRCRSALMIGEDDAAGPAALEAGILVEPLPPEPLRVIGLLAAGEERTATGDPAAAGSIKTALATARTLEPVPGTLTADCLRSLARVTPPEESARHLTESLAIAERLGDPYAIVHDLRHLGRAQRDSSRGADALDYFSRSARWADGLDPPGLAAARVLIEAAAAGRRADAAPELAAAEGRWRDQRWLRRIRTLDGERPFADGAPDYLGPSIDQTLRDMRSRHSSVAGVPLVVGPHRGPRS
ncbi:tetratricopeptide (TPR) repeat protein [Actinoplanes tereljensis]|uniref:TIR domain-containing protein n=1 Tax=Paractinoplanes tereljensis TaxID=571912 RepID=A0A919NWC6_9ACTN|nr:CHAT domain-containing protein [Actinoplanes tereljensis]GIF26529.1 hypothetical protein Ate02nite_92590 [Actinoplanes tereljensis]